MPNRGPQKCSFTNLANALHWSSDSLSTQTHTHTQADTQEAGNNKCVPHEAPESNASERKGQGR